METFVVALGGNALLDFGEKPTFSVQYRNASRTARSLSPLLKRDDTSIVITHGNGPQVGNELLRNEFAKEEMPRLPMHVLIAETQAFIGTMLELALKQELIRIGSRREVVALLTHVCVDSKDGAFEKPAKPIGPFYTRMQLETELRREPFSFIKRRGRYRRVVASPEPLKIMEIGAVRTLIKRNAIVIAAGGGGIPVIEERGSYRGIDAVIDKDLTTQLLASSLKADTLAILTNFDRVYRDYGNRREPISRIRIGELGAIVDCFEEGTMQPKLRACMRFIENGGRAAYIGNLFRLEAMLAGTSGTEIVR
jgi:carbamate kinase